MTRRTSDGGAHQPGSGTFGEQSSFPERDPPPIVRLVLLAVALVAAFAAFWVFDLLDTDDVRGLIEPFGAFAAPAYVVIAAVLGAAMVPGPLLSATSGVLFGAAAGTAVSLGSAVLSALISLYLARGAGPLPRGERIDALADLAQRHGFTAVVVQRLVPGIPDAPASYVFGALGTRAWQIALGTLVGSAPRAFSYTSVGASLDDPDSPLALAGVAGLVITAIVGLVVARRFLTRRG